jgi:hypothetical protein
MFFCIKNEPSKMGQYGRYCRIVFTYSTWLTSKKYKYLTPHPPIRQFLERCYPWGLFSFWWTQMALLDTSVACHCCSNRNDRQSLKAAPQLGGTTLKDGSWESWEPEHCLRAVACFNKPHQPDRL